jgi:hypothetical protein
MKPIIFARISDMEYYKGITPTDKPRNGGSHVDETGEAHEAFNFDAIEFNGEKICLGFAMLIGNSSQTNLQIRLESMIGGKHLKKEQYVDGVTVVWCAKDPFENHIRVVGFYKNATVYRHSQEMDFFDENNELCYVQNYNFVAKEENCVLLPYGERNRNKWRVPTSGKNGANFGFGRSSIWYANSNGENPKEDKFVECMLENIDNYTGKNLMEE